MAPFAPPLTPPLTPPVPAWYASHRSEHHSGADPCQSEAPLPPLIHTLHQESSSVLSLAADDRWIFSGSQTKDIYVWDRDTFQVAGVLKGHEGSVLSLEASAAKKWLFSSSDDSTVRIWSTETLAPLYVLVPWDDYGSGDIFSIAFSPETETLFLGCQNTSLQWFDFSEGSRDWDVNVAPGTPILGGAMTPNFAANRKPHKFFDSEPQPAGRPTPSRGGNSHPVTPPSGLRPLPGLATPPRSAPPSTYGLPPEPRVLTMPPDNWVHSAHYGYIYCMALVPDSVVITEGVRGVQLVTGSGDEDVKLWSYTARPADEPNNMQLLHTFHSGTGGVLSILARNGNIYAGCQEGQVKIWDIDTKTLVRTIIVQENVDILSLSIVDADLYTCSSNGCVRRYSPTFDRAGCWKAHTATLLSSIIIPSRNNTPQDREEHMDFVTGATDNSVKVWAIGSRKSKKGLARSLHRGLSHKAVPSQEAPHGNDKISVQTNDLLVHSLSQFISIESVSNNPSHKEDCRQAAIWLKKCFTQFGAESKLLYGDEDKNPVVFGTFRGTESKTFKPRVLFYGHYDVVNAGAPHAWDHDPFQLTGFNGYLYGRGVSDNKGPVLAVACAASEMLARRSLDIDLVLLIEGEEEAGSGGFTEAVQKYKDEIGHIDAILVSNSYWIDDARPCITYGLRGVIHATVEVRYEGPDLHSGVDGGARPEPMMDMAKVLAQMCNGTSAAFPGFYDRVRAPSPEEDEIFELLAEVTGRTPKSFATRWREPALSVHSVGDSTLANTTVIPARVRAKLSVRVVPDQDLEEIVQSIESYINARFAELNSPNTLSIDIDRTADWWIGSFDNPWFQALEGAICDEWGVKPLRIREGGSIPSIPWLEKFLGCPAVHLPMGQSSDQAHLRNERLSLNNLRKGKAVVERFFQRVAALQSSKVTI